MCQCRLVTEGGRRELLAQRKKSLSNFRRLTRKEATDVTSEGSTGEEGGYKQVRDSHQELGLGKKWMQLVF